MSQYLEAIIDNLEKKVSVQQEDIYKLERNMRQLEECVRALNEKVDRK
ncbi:hypothetical protein OCA26_14920 [Bacillus cereus]|nr:hypothetical protein [Bacillus cereus]